MFGLAEKISSAIGAAMGAGLLALVILLSIQKAETRHWKKQYEGEKAAHALTVANYGKAAAEAAAADLAHARTVETKYATIAKEQSDDLSRKLEAARASAADYARRLRTASQADPGRGAAAHMSGAASATGDPAGSGEAAELDAMICAENTVKARGWRDWWNRVEGSR
ncbi:hypothetical protein [Sphingomonas sp. SCN 67-18]|uniref:hypothetical protein n=1 Tax=uncultured Sphingomonas sp. TaxID=158754 RepID=UPI0025F19086|nr:hypothetical protein [Sphingomonas sp. SCN 67-18]